MQEFTAVSVSSYDSAALVAKLNEKSAEGWSVVSIVQTGGDVTAFLGRAASANSSAAPAAAEPAAAATPAAAPAAAEPSGWAVAPEPAAQAQPQPQSAAQYQPAAQTYQPAAQTYQPAAAPQAQPAVPANWYADPAGRFELRYWDGTQWTEHVSRGGQQFTDPPVA